MVTNTEPRPTVSEERVLEIAHAIRHHVYFTRRDNGSDELCGAEAAARYIASLPPEPQAQEWRTMESAPRDGKSIIVWHKVHGAMTARFCPGEWSTHHEFGREYNGPVWCFGDDVFQEEVEEGPDGFHDGSVTHWRPATSPPGEAAGAPEPGKESVGIIGHVSHDKSSLGHAVTEMLRQQESRAIGPACGRPKGSNADEWHLFLQEHKDALPYVAVHIAEAIEAATTHPEQASQVQDLISENRRLQFRICCQRNVISRLNDRLASQVSERERVLEEAAKIAHDHALYWADVHDATSPKDPSRAVATGKSAVCEQVSFAIRNLAQEGGHGR